ncbi:MAG: glycosyltransferase [bacterium]|nr:glycosyltransferase [bacterium]
MITFSVIIPARPNAQIKALESLKNIEYDPAHWEIIVVEGRQPSIQRNKAVSIAKGEIIFFLDDDSEPIPQLFNSVLEFYKEAQVVVVGGPCLMKPTEKELPKELDLILKSCFGTFNTAARWCVAGNQPKKATEKDLIMCNLSMRKEIFLKEGGLNESLYPNEENEFLHRLEKKGYRLVYNPKTVVYRERHRRLQDFIKSIFYYGRGRVKQNFISPTIKDIPHTIPFLFVIYLFSLLFIHSPWFWYLPAVAYGLLNLFFSCRIICQEGHIKYLFSSPFLFLLLHLSYGLGLGFGLVSVMAGRHKSPSSEINVRIVKLYER